jgi:hypothetical protein
MASGDSMVFSPAQAAFEEDVFWFMNLGCVALATFTFIRWRGDARTGLLLKLVQLHENDDTQRTAAPNVGPARPQGISGIAEGPASVS